MCLVSLLLATVATLAQSTPLVLTNGPATCVLDPIGARVISYRVSGKELVWCPESLDKSDARWVHGGIPIAWPWFGRLGKGDEHIHGYAWKSTFIVEHSSATRLILKLETDAAQLVYEISLNPMLTLRLRTKNRSRFDLPFAQAFHPYFLVDERDESAVTGLFPEPLTLTAAIDRGVCFEDAEAKKVCFLQDKRANRVLRIETTGATGINVWNPGFEKLCPGKIPSEAWRRFVAIEPYVMGLNRLVVLKPGEEIVLSMSVSLTAPTTSCR